MAPPSVVMYPITGIAGKDGKVGPDKDGKVGVRQNIDQWSANPDNEKQVKLFVMALDRFQKIDPAEQLSYFQVAGIHGQPNDSWGETQEELKGEDINGKSYCTHNTVLFPTWHRPYLVLYEQRLYEIMRDTIIPGFPKDQQAEWRAAADSWRLPFWDWNIANSNSQRSTVKVPLLSKYPTTSVPKADLSGEERIDNPLFQFKMPNNRPMSEYKVQEFLDPWNTGKRDHIDYGKCIGTSRHPDDEDAGIRKNRRTDKDGNFYRDDTDAWRHGVVNNSEVERAFQKPTWFFPDGPGDDQAQVAQKKNDKFGKPAEAVYRLLTTPNISYATFATTGRNVSEDTVVDSLNIEFIHNLIHGWVGGDNYGHMSQIPVASFDPLFWLHHANIDRIFALWQALNPQRWFTTGTVEDFAPQQIIGLPPPKDGKKTEISPKTPLRPFRKDTKGTYLTSEDVRDIYKLGYTYPELQRWQAKYNEGGVFDQEAYINDIHEQINTLYGESRDILLGNNELPGTSPVDGGIKSTDFSFTIKFRKYGLGGDPFWVKLYLKSGKSEDAPNPKSDIPIAEVYNFSQKPEVDGKPRCANCKTDQKKNAWSTSYLCITPVLCKLIAAGKELKSLSRDEVLKFLQKNVYWRVFKNGEVVPSYDLKKVDPQIIGSSNDNTSFNDPTKLPQLENFKEEDTLKGGADGALDPANKQPVEQPPLPLPDIPKADLPVGQTLKFKEEIGKDSVIIIDSSKLDLNKAKGDSIDNTQIYLTDAAGNLVFLMSLRRLEGQIVFNTKQGDSWGKEERVSLDNRFKTAKPTVMIHDQGEGWEIFIDWVHVTWFQKRVKDAKAVSISYTVNKGYSSVWSQGLQVKTYKSMKELFNH